MNTILLILTMSELFTVVSDINCRHTKELSARSTIAINAGTKLLCERIDNNWVSVNLTVPLLEVLQYSTLWLNVNDPHQSVLKYHGKLQHHKEHVIGTHWKLGVKKMYLPIKVEDKILLVSGANIVGNNNTSKLPCKSCNKLFSNKTIERNDGLCTKCMNGKRPNINKRLRRAVWEKRTDKTTGNCYACEAHIDIDNFECGHIIAFDKGGSIDLSNLEPICRSCNRACATKNLLDFMKALK